MKMPPFPSALLGAIVLLAGIAPNAHPQAADSPLRIFGYFQNTVYYQHVYDGGETSTSFVLQHLNVIFRGQLTQRWTSFVDFEFTNTYSSVRRWGTFEVEQAWVNYRRDRRFSLKLGLLTPQFNHLNEIKNRTPLLPYIIRPFAYETSFEEIINFENLIPQRAFAQIQGHFPHGPLKYDYALYLGNSPNINVDALRDQTGIDTTDAFMVGGRLGIRHKDFKAGISAALDRVNFFLGADSVFGGSPDRFNQIPRWRLGADFRYERGRAYVETEYATSIFDDGEPQLKANTEFFYVTGAYRATEKLLIYVTEWLLAEDNTLLDERGDPYTNRYRVTITGGGTAYHINDNVVFKTAAAWGAHNVGNDFAWAGLAVSVLF